MKKFRVYMLIVLVIFTFLSPYFIMPVSVYADKSDTSETSTTESDGNNTNSKKSDSKVSDEDMKSKVGCSDDNFNRIKAIVSIMQADGYSNEAIAGALGNSWQESGWTPGSEGMWGLCDTYNNWCNSSYYKNCTHLKQYHNDNGAGGTHEYMWCSEGTCTTAFAMDTLKKDMKSYCGNMKNYNSMLAAHYDEIKNWKFNGAEDVPQHIDEIDSLDTFKSSKDVYSTAICWMDVMERCKGIFLYCKGGWHSANGSWDESWWEPERASGLENYGAIKNLFTHEHGTKGAGRPYNGSVVYSWLTGTTFSGGSLSNSSEDVVKETQASLAASLNINGYWSDEQLSSYCKLHELNLQEVLDKATKSSLNQNELQTLTSWKTNVDNGSLMSRIFSLLRRIVMFIGIFFTIYGILLYVAFWFDRVNNIFDIGLLGILSKNGLHTALIDSDANFGKHNRFGENVTVAHKDIIKISLLLIVVGAVIISGYLYIGLQSLVDFIFRIFGL